nr:hypothetical protein CFP56_78393 [Quercus suber]
MRVESNERPALRVASTGSAARWGITNIHSGRWDEMGLDGRQEKARRDRRADTVYCAQCAVLTTTHRKQHLTTGAIQQKQDRFRKELCGAVIGRLRWRLKGGVDGCARFKRRPLEALARSSQSCTRYGLLVDQHRAGSSRHILRCGTAGDEAKRETRAVKGRMKDDV